MKQKKKKKRLSEKYPLIKFCLIGNDAFIYDEIKNPKHWKPICAHENLICLKCKEILLERCPHGYIKRNFICPVCPATMLYPDYTRPEKIAYLQKRIHIFLKKNLFKIY